MARRLKVPIWVYDIDNSRMAHANTAACALWEADTEASLRERDMTEGMSSTVAKRLRQYQSDFIETDSTFKELWTLYPNGKAISVMVIYSGFVLPDGRMAMQCEVVGKTEDEPQNVRSAEALLHTDVMITLYAKGGPPLYMNPASRNAAAETYHGLADIFLNPDDYAALAMGLSALGEHRLVAEIMTFSGPRWYDLSAKSCSDAATGQPAVLVTAVDVSELKVARDKARFLANRDQLTGCYNRTFLQNHMASRFGAVGGIDCGVVYFDVDRFKLINDRYGHEVGDTVLRLIASRTVETFGADTIVARLGGDEFVILLEGRAHADDIAGDLTRLRDAVAAPIYHNQVRIHATISMGVALFTPGKTVFTDVMREADIALYASKEMGRNRWTFFNEAMGDAARERSLIESELRRAIEQQEFVLHYQPRIDLGTGRVVSAEALVRWEHPERGTIMPDRFIPICEETGMIEDLGRFVLEKGCEQAIAWKAADMDLSLSLNISPRQFNDEQFLPSLLDLSRRAGFPTGEIELEVTESVLIGDHMVIADKLMAITRMGYRIAIDDFGTGYSNLSYISRFPLTCLKIDRSFIDQLPTSGPIINLILTLARQIGATAVAEGVETREQLDWLSAQDCEQVQGYFLSRPVPLSDFDTVVAKLNARI